MQKKRSNNMWRVKEQLNNRCIATKDEDFDSIVEFDDKTKAFRYYVQAYNTNYRTILEEKVNDKWEYRAASCVS